MANELMNANGNAIMAVNEVMETGVGYSSMNVQDHDQAVAFYNAVTNPTGKLKEHINETLNLVHVSVEPVEVKREDGTTNIAPRIVLVTDAGESYSCVSVGVYAALKRIFSLFGTPDTWKNPLPIKPVLQATKKGQVLSIQLV